MDLHRNTNFGSIFVFAKYCGRHFFMLHQNWNQKTINRVYYFGEKLSFYSAKTIFAISYLKLSKTKTFAVYKTTYLKPSREKLCL